MRQKTKNTITWFVWNGLIVSSWTLFLFFGSEGAGNVITFVAWISVVMAFLVMVAGIVNTAAFDELEDPQIKSIMSIIENKAFNIQLDYCIDSIIIFGLVWFGQVGLACLFTIHVIFYAIGFSMFKTLYEKIDEDKKGNFQVSESGWEIDGLQDCIREAPKDRSE